VLLQNTDQTKSYAKEFVKQLPGRKVIALFGELGSGKTTFVQGLAQGLGIEKRVLSPTFVFQRSYDLKNKPFKRFHHLDLYRLVNLADAESIGIEEILAEKDSLIAIEWPEIIEKVLPKNTVKIRFKKISDSEREISVDP